MWNFLYLFKQPNLLNNKKKGYSQNTIASENILHSIL